MAGRKRTSTGTREGVDSTRPHKAPRVTSEVKEVSKGKSKSKKNSQAIPRSTFQNEALPIHVNFTHTPAAVIDNEEQETIPSDPGHIGNITMLPSLFSTGSYGWKGAHRVAVELQRTEGKEKEKVLVMINVNATVVGSKGAADIEEIVEAEEETSKVNEGENKEFQSAKDATANDVHVDDKEAAGS